MSSQLITVIQWFIIASIILKNMNQEVEACDDFYEFACGGFIKSTTIPDDKTEVNLFSVVNDKLQEKLRLNMEEPSKPDELRTFKLVKNLYNTCLNTCESCHAITCHTSMINIIHQPDTIWEIYRFQLQSKRRACQHSTTSWRKSGDGLYSKGIIGGMTHSPG